MEIPVLARMSDFDATIASFSVANPHLISRLLSIFELGRFSAPQRFWKWGAILLALIYAFSSVVRRIKILFVQRHRRLTSKLCSSSEPLLACSDDDDEEDAENDDVSSSCSSEDERREVDLASSSYENLGGFYEDFRVAGFENSCDRRGEKKRKFRIRRRRSLAGDNFSSLAELVSGKGVVKLWDGLGFGLDLGVSPSTSNSSGDSISIFDLNKDVMIGSVMGQIPAVSVSPSSPRVVFTASAGDDGRVSLSSWDMRLRQRRSAVDAEWRMERRTGPVVEVKAGGVDKVYVRDDVSGNMTVGDMRKARSPLVNVTEFDGDRWYESNVVSETEE